MTWMDVIMMLVTKANSGHCACCMTGSGSLAWPLKCRRQLVAASDASNMKAFVPKPKCDPSLSLLLWSCFMLTLPALRPWWRWIAPQMWWTFWSFMTILQNTSLCTWPPIKLQKLLSGFCGKATSWSLEHWPSSWVTEEPALKATSSESFVGLWAYGKVGLHLTMLRPMARLNELTKCRCTW